MSRHGADDMSGANARNHVAELVRRLNAQLGGAQVAALAGVSDLALVEQWEDVHADPPGSGVQVRLLRAHTVCFGITQLLGGSAAREWMTSPSPLLKGASPVEAISEDRFKEVTQAAKAHVAVAA